MKIMPPRTFKTPSDIIAFRKEHNMNQTEFWSRIGLTQSGGSRWEREHRDISRIIQTLLTITYGNKVQSDMAVAELRDWQG